MTMRIQMKVSLVGQFATTDDIKGGSLRYHGVVVGSIVVLSPHLEVLKPESQCFNFSSDRVEPCLVAILEIHFNSLLFSPLTELLHRGCHEFPLLISESDSLLFIPDFFGRNRLFEEAIICLGERLAVVRGVSSQLQRRLIGMAFGSSLGDRFLMGEETFKGTDIVVGVGMGVLELVNVANFGKIFAINILIVLQGPHSSEESLVRLINFHKLQIQSIKEGSLLSRLIFQQQALINVRTISEVMDLGSLIAIFFTVAAVLLTLLCLLMKWVHYRTSKQRKNAADQYQDNQKLVWMSGDRLDGAYKEFCACRQEKRKTSLKESLLEEDILLQQAQNQSLLILSDDIYTPSRLCRKLTTEIELPRLHTDRSLFPLNQFKLQRVNTTEFTKRSKSDSSYFKFVKQLIQYDRKGIHLLQIVPLTLCKIEGQILLQKTVHSQIVESSEPHFEDLLESYGYEAYCYGCSQLICEVDTADFKENEIYTLKNIDYRSQKQQITQQVYDHLLETLQDSI